MKIIIDIPEDTYAEIVEYGIANWYSLTMAFRDGQPIPDNCEILTKEAYEDLCARASGLRGDTDGSNN